MSVRFDRPKLARHWIADELRRRIVDGELGPGRRVRQDEVATEFGTSQGPVREALRTLAGENLLTHETNRGYRVVSISPHDVEEIRVVRELLETEALRLAVPRLTDDDLADLRRLYEILGELGRAGGPAFNDTHEAFHLTIFERAGAPRLQAMVRAQWQQAQRIRAVALRDAAGRAANAADQHRALLRACLDRDAGAAIEAMNRHRDDAARAAEAALLAATDTGDVPVTRPSPRRPTVTELEGLL